MKKITAFLCVMSLFIFTISCRGNMDETASEVNPDISSDFISVEEVSSNDNSTQMLAKLNDIVAKLCGSGYSAEYKENSMIGDALVSIYSVKGDTDVTWLFAHDGEENFYIDRISDGNWQSILSDDNGGYYIGESAVITHTEDEYILFIGSLSDDIFGTAEDRKIVKAGQSIFDEFLLDKYSITQGGVVVGHIALNDTADVVYVDRGSGEYERFTGDLSKYQAKG